MITLIFLWLFLPFVLTCFAVIAGICLVKWVFHVLDKSLEEDDTDSTHPQ